LNSPAGREQSESAAIGAAQRTVSLGRLKKFKILVPSLNEQKVIVDRCRKVENIAEYNQRINLKIELAQSSLLQKAFRGEL